MRIYLPLVLVALVGFFSTKALAKAPYESPRYAYYCTNGESADSNNYVSFHVDGVRFDQKTQVRVSVSTNYRRYDEWKATSLVESWGDLYLITIVNNRFCRGTSCQEGIYIQRPRKSPEFRIRADLKLADGSVSTLTCDESLSVLDL
ncbi:MAG: hypothetical protein BroJett040_11160 [Oligoflexia bacterium]|nr:MAG: hypothetical protein BroJett040_11160 [Oligoflexia bacterium]